MADNKSCDLMSLENCLIPEQPDTLSMFLNSVIPAKAMLAHFRNLPTCDNEIPGYMRRTNEPIVRFDVLDHGTDDFADWTAAHSERFQAESIQSNPSAALLDPMERLQEVYMGRWLRTSTSTAASTTLPPGGIRPRSSTVLQSQKRYKPGPFGELRRPPTRSTVGATIRSQNARLNGPTVRLDSAGSRAAARLPVLYNRNRSDLPRAMLHPVGGVERIVCHAAAYIAPNVYVFGGLTKNGCSDRMWSLLPVESGWRYVEPIGDERPSSRYGHALVAWRDQLVLFGGDGGPGYLDDLWYFDTGKREWSRISLEQEQEGRRPGARTGHSAVVYNDEMIVFGGWRGGDGFCDVWACDLEARTWDLLFYRGSAQRELKSSASEGMRCCTDNIEMPEPRQWHICGIFGDFMYIHGGYGFGGVLRHVWRFHLPTRSWQFVPTRGREPSARCRHSGVVVGDSKWVVFGGKDAEGAYFCDMFVLDILTHTWHSTTLLSPPHEISSQESEWWNCSDVLRGLPYLHCQATAYDHINKCIVVTGGCDGEAAAYDSTILLKRYPAAALLFEEWRHSRPRRSAMPRGMDLPEFLHRHPEPAAREILQFL